MKHRPESSRGFRCTFGFHSWTDWRYTDKHSCEQSKKCKRCANEELRIQHRMSDWSYDDPNGCSQRRQCSRCAKENEQRERHRDGTYHTDLECRVFKFCRHCDWTMATDAYNHSWAPEGYETPGSCLIGRRCKKCGTFDSPSWEYQHDWTSPFFDAEDSCVTLRRCNRCGEVEQFTDVDHSWDDGTLKPPDSADSCRILYRCRRCAATTESSEPDHRWGPYESGANRCTRLRRCLRCGRTDPDIQYDHYWEWRYHTSEICEQARYCEICDALGEGSLTRHDWSDAKGDVGAICFRCGCSVSDQNLPFS